MPAGGTYSGMIVAGPPGSAGQYRDVGPDKHGFVYRQYTNGVIVILQAPRVDNFGAWHAGTRGGPMEGQTVNPGTPLWSKITRQIGEHPQQPRLRAEIAQLQQQVADNPQMSGPGSWAGARGQGPGVYGRPFIDTLTEITSGFTEDPRGPTGEFTQTLVQAAPNIQATIAQLTTPSTLAGMAKKLGKLKGELAVTRDPKRRAMLAEQIAAYEYQIGLLKGQMNPVQEPLQEPTGSWIPWAIGGTILAMMGVLALGRPRRRR